jgi:hypothetical protein
MSLLKSQAAWIAASTSGKPPGPSLGQCDIAGDRRRAAFGKLRSGVGSRQTADIMSAPDEFSHHG